MEKDENNDDDDDAVSEKNKENRGIGHVSSQQQRRRRRLSAMSTEREEEEVEKESAFAYVPRRLSEATERLLPYKGGHRHHVAETIPLKIRIGYGFGHVMNDMTASLWFTYILLFLDNNVQLAEVNAGVVFLTGQIVDAVFNPIAGLLIDSFGPGHANIRVYCVVFGSVGVAITFACLWWIPPFVDGEEVAQWKKVLWYACWGAVFNIFWSFVQVAHFSLVDEIATSTEAKLTLNKVGQVGSALAAVTTFALARVVFHMEHLDHDTQFEILICLVVAIGLLSVAIFTTLLLNMQCGSVVIRCPSTDAAGDDDDDDDSNAKKIDRPREQTKTNDSKRPSVEWSDFFCMSLFYEAITLYALSRMVMIIVMTFLAPYLAACTDHTTGMQVSALAMVLYHMFYCITVTAEFWCCPRFGKNGRRYLLVSYMMLALASGVLTMSIWILDPYLHDDEGVHYIYLPMALCGCVSYYMVATSRTIVNHISGKHASTFVIGFAGFVEKAVIGAAVILIQESERTSDDGYWWAISIFPSVTALAAICIAACCLYTEVQFPSDDDVSSDDEAIDAESGEGDVIGKGSTERSTLRRRR